MPVLVDRMIRAARLDSSLYEEVEADRTAMGQAMGVVLISAVAAGIGGVGAGAAAGFVAGVLAALVGWFLWSLLIWLIGTKLLPEPQTEADLGQLLRTIGFSASPGVIRVLGFIPILGWVVTIVANIWMLAAMVVAARQALDYRGTGRAVVVCLLGWLVHVALTAVVGALFLRGAGME
jgi:hypothetical protein